MLLDTHVLLWWLGDAPELPTTARERIATTVEPVLVSAVSLFEIETKRRLGKLDAPDDVLGACADEQFTILPLSGSAAAAAGAFDWAHRDPFDRLLVAQARERGVQLLTADQRILDREPLATRG
jgi:PIN domain nuclease of toxin-antitoxin system